MKTRTALTAFKNQLGLFAKSNYSSMGIINDPHLVLFASNSAITNNEQVLPSFLNMIKEVNNTGQPFSLILRSTSADTGKTMLDISKETGIEFDQKLHMKGGILEFKKDYLVTPDQMLKVVVPGKHCSWENTAHNKIVYPLNTGNLADVLTIHIADANSNVPVKILDGHNNHCKNIDPKELRQLMVSQGRLVYSDPQSAIKDEIHFIKQLQKALEFRVKWLNDSLNTASDTYSASSPSNVTSPCNLSKFN